MSNVAELLKASIDAERQLMTAQQALDAQQKDARRQARALREALGGASGNATAARTALQAAIRESAMEVVE